MNFCDKFKIKNCIIINNWDYKKTKTKNKQNQTQEKKKKKKKLNNQPRKRKKRKKKKAVPADRYGPTNSVKNIE